MQTNYAKLNPVVHLLDYRHKSESISKSITTLRQDPMYAHQEYLTTLVDQSAKLFSSHPPGAIQAQLRDMADVLCVDYSTQVNGQKNNAILQTIIDLSQILHSLENVVRTLPYDGEVNL